VTPAAGIALLGLGLAVAAGAFDAEPLWAPGLGLLAVAAGAEGWLRLVARGASVRRRLGARRVIEDEPLDVVLDVTLGSGLPPPGGAIRDSLVPAGLPLRPGRVRLRVSFARRGRRILAAPRLELRDPLGLSRREVAGEGPGDEVLVLPRLHPVESSGQSGDGRAGARDMAALLAAVEVDGLRPYRDGTPASRIHWPALARGAGLLERRLHADADARPLVVLDARAPASPAALDAAVRATASLAHALARAGGCAVLLPGDRRARTLEPDLAGWPALHARLAVVEGGAPVPAAATARRGPLVYVAARPVRRIPPAVAAAARGSPTLVVPGALAARTASFAVAGCSGYRMRADDRTRAA
jgi:uncharacterized protein (DUF58 family)